MDGILNRALNTADPAGAVVDARQTLITGMTRDRTILIEVAPTPRPRDFRFTRVRRF